MKEELRILIIKMSSLGDIIHALPTLYALRERYPKAYIAWAVHEQFKDMIPPEPWVNEVIIINKKQLKSFSYLRKLWRTLHDYKFDISLDLQSIAKSAIVSALSGAKEKYAYWELREGSWLVNKALVGDHKFDHVIERYLDTARALDCHVSSIHFPLPYDREAHQSIRSQLEHKGIDESTPYIVIAPGARWTVKEWPVEKYMDLCKYLVEEGRKVVLLGAKDDIEKGDAIVNGVSNPHLVNMIGYTSLQELVELIRHSELYISADTGPLHIANALQVPLVALFGTTSPERTGPYGGDHIHIIISPTSRASVKEPLINDPDCMNQISVDQVISVVKGVLNHDRTES